MIFVETPLQGSFIIIPERIKDIRGFFARTWCKKEFEAHGLNTVLTQSNIAFNHKKGTLRGMHFQKSPYEEIKLVRCTAGSIYDVIIDLRSHSSTYMKWTGVELTAENLKMLYVPAGFAHGYQTLADNSEVFYQVSQYYTPEAEDGVRWNDPAFQIEWPDDYRIISEKDQKWPDFKCHNI
ncbi:MAG: dTDP-4-dehydrorhamnose 3,5-epimerase [Candidatus Loosdrechtia sp.]|uniref:dTDP-4-dehydrorhamnose 3,5-epimerase family protein n=1 Tax=Candidatus Loosdrechtia sp. TaxID=3101272 RepID=UPI003A66E1D0|nr:MAG: dTDP-4-dehydrorhamnose 3,5-epimerase [Candidatus Jettenia sp. AMX2]